MDIQKEFFKYLQYWPWFVLSTFLFIGASLVYLSMVQPVYTTSTLININKAEDQKTQPIILPGYQNNSYNENPLAPEIMLITSNEFIEELVRSLQINISYYEKGYVQSTMVLDVPFIITPKISNDSLPSISYDISITKQGYTIVNAITKKSSVIPLRKGIQTIAEIPFTIQWKSKKINSSYFGKDYTVALESTASAVNNLKASLSVEYSDSAKGSLLVSHSGTNSILSRAILNELIVLLDKNIIINKKKLFTNTVSFLNQRIEDFSKEKDSIENEKERFLQNKDILVLPSYISDKTQEKNLKKQNSLDNEKQIVLTKYAIKEIRKIDSNASLGTDYKLEEPTFNQLLSNYNTSFMESELLLQRAQKNNPAYLSLISQLKIKKLVILKTLENYLGYLNRTNVTNQSEQNIANSEAKTIPTKDKILSNLSSNLSMKQGLYMILLQSRETAILNGAVMESNLKTLNAPSTNYSPIFPKKKPLLLGAFLLGLLLPFGIVYLILALDTKIHNEEDLLNEISDAAYLGAIPLVEHNLKLINTANSRSLIAESTRSLFSNLSYLLSQKQDDKAAVVLVTSSIKGEGKSFTAYHNSLTISYLNKKVLLIGADLRNPQLHDYFNIDKHSLGLSNFLSNPKTGWKDFLKKSVNLSENLDLLLSGSIPPNPSQLLTNLNFKLLIEEAKMIYDFIVIDSAPVQLVSDTLSFSAMADVTVFVVRESYTDRKSLVMVKQLIEKGQLKNVGFVINGFNIKRRAYGYNYGYNYSYSYNYGLEEEKTPWYKKSS